MMADGRHFENRKCAITRPWIVRSSPNFDVDEDTGANLNFSQKLRKYENPIWWTAAFLKIQNIKKIFI